MQLIMADFGGDAHQSQLAAPLLPFHYGLWEIVIRGFLLRWPADPVFSTGRSACSSQLAIRYRPDAFNAAAGTQKKGRRPNATNAMSSVYSIKILAGLVLQESLKKNLESLHVVPWGPYTQIDYLSRTPCERYSQWSVERCLRWL